MNESSYMYIFIFDFLLNSTDDEEGYKVARQYSELDSFAKSLGSKLHAPYMALSFITLLVIPELKLSDKGLFDGERFDLISLFE